MHPQIGIKYKIIAECFPNWGRHPFVGREFELVEEGQNYWKFSPNFGYPESSGEYCIVDKSSFNKFQFGIHWYLAQCLKSKEL